MTLVGRLRVAGVIGVLVPATLVLMGLQALALRFDWRLAHEIPVVFHRMVCRLMRIDVRTKGAPSIARPLLLVSNHSSWLDITVLSSILPVSFIAKQEVAGWPIFGTFARLQRSIFIDRTRRAATREANKAIGGRLAGGDALVLFAEGTTSDGSRVLPFKSSLLGAARDALAAATHNSHVLVQPVAVCYPRRNGLPVGRVERPMIAWHGSMDLLPHLAAIIAGGPIDASVVFGDPIAFESTSDRKAVTRCVEDIVREAIVTTTRRPAAPVS
jgi:1-acyl-sn-glycerol-3-phosphate acyltransferase